MSSSEKTPRILDDVKVNVKLKISAFWVTLMLLYIYVDIFMFYKPGILSDIIAGKVWKFEITQIWALGALLLMTIPALMVFLSLVLPAKVNRWINIIVSIIYIILGLGTTVGESWISYIFGHIIGIIVLLMIVWHAWKWPKQES